MPVRFRNRVIPTAPSPRFVKLRLREEDRRNNRGHYTTHRALLHGPCKMGCLNLGSFVPSLLGSPTDLQVEIQIVASFTRIQVSMSPLDTPFLINNLREVSSQR